jgi:hypothetical protein
MVTGDDVLERLPARYRSTIWIVGLLAFAVVSGWLAVLIRGPLLTGTDVVLATGAGLAIGIPAIHLFLALLCADVRGPFRAR